MKQATLIFVRTLSAISQNDPVMSKKKNRLIDKFKTAIEEDDRETVAKLLEELYLSTDNDYFHREIDKCRESLSY